MRLELDGLWRMKDVKESQWNEANVPGTVYADLLAAGKVPDAYYRDNETEVQSVFDQDYEYSRSFSVGEELLSCDELTLCCEGLDTLATVSINGVVVAETNNMHRTYRINVSKAVQLGENTITVLLHSPTQFVRSVEAETPGARGVTHIRKAACMFGWDWGLSLPDSGIWRSIYVDGHSVARLVDISVQQNHSPDDVTLTISAEIERFTADKSLTIAVSVDSPDGGTLLERTASADGASASITVAIPNPELWWPAGQGAQPLYTVRATLMADGSAIDDQQHRIGLRRVELIREHDEIGRSYAFEINGTRIFAKGANMIIPDAILARRSEELARKMVRDSVDANFNFIRVWGGAIYPDNYFYDLCDEYGILLFHDFMFACNFYPADSTFVDNVRAEVEDNVKRARNHACIALWSGNNEVELTLQFLTGPDSKELMETLGVTDMALPPEVGVKLKADLETLFYDVMGPLVQQLAPQTSWVAGSPIGEIKGEVPVSSMMAATSGDTHYYLAFNDRRPYEEIQHISARFVSEIGFQSYPNQRTIEAFTKPDDRSPYTEVMLQHQKSHDGNQVLETYVDREYRVPTDFDAYVYATQAVSAVVTATSVEHFRRQTGACMGYLAWQLNDCWPAVSWSGVDHGGRWKAQQYSLRRSFAPVMISALADGGKIGLFVNNDRPSRANVIVEWTLFDMSHQPVSSGIEHAELPSQAVLRVTEIDFTEQVGGSANRHYVAYSVTDGDAPVSRGIYLFAPPRQYEFQSPNIEVDVDDQGDHYLVGLTSDTLVYSLALELADCDAVFGDNYFHLLAGQKYVVRLPKATMSIPLNAEQISSALNWMSAFDLQ